MQPQHEEAPPVGDPGPTRPSAGASPAAIEHHYDVSSAFYRLWLGEGMVYSCALWEGALDDRLEEAQQAKLSWHASMAAADGAERVLDVGCGWGAMLHHLTGSRRVGHATGLTLSTDQAATIRSASRPGVEVRLEDWRDHRPDAPYDAIVSIGAFEHFARPDLSPAQRHAEYSGFFAACAGWLSPGGRVSLQSIGWEDFDPATGKSSGFLNEEIFPESSLPLLTEIVAAADPWFRVLAVRSDAEQYEHTLHLWQRRLEAHRDEAIEIVGRETYRRYLRYLRVSRALFDRRTCTLYRLALERRAVAVRQRR